MILGERGCTMDNYQSNSNMSKEKKPEPVVNASTNTKKKSEFSKVKDHILQDELPKTRNHIVYDILIPRVKQIVLDSFAALLGGSYSSGPNVNTRSNNRVNYNQASTQNRNATRATSRPIGFDYDYIEFDNRLDAQTVLDSMYDIIHERGSVSISQMYALANIDQCPHTYEYYGWMLNTPNDLNGSYVKQDMYSGKYVIVCNRPTQIR